MKLLKVVSTLTIAAIFVLPLAGLTGCTGPLPRSANNTNTTQFAEYENTSDLEYNFNTTN